MSIKKTSDDPPEYVSDDPAADHARFETLVKRGVNLTAEELKKMREIKPIKKDRKIAQELSRKDETR